MKSPLLFYKMEELKKTITQIAERHLKDDTYFIVDVVVKGVQGKTKILVLLDSDQGVNIDDCARLSRKIGGELEEDEVLDIAYILEVSSPGLDHPLAMERQYIKNIGRKLRVHTIEGSVCEGTLLEFSNQVLYLETLEKEKNKKVPKKVEVPFSTIQKANVLASFK